MGNTMIKKKVTERRNAAKMCEGLLISKSMEKDNMCDLIKVFKY
jgi:hypothetical protein